MRKRMICVLASALIVGLAGPAAAPAATKSCTEKNANASQLKATGVGCAKARKAMLGWIDRCLTAGPLPLYQRAYPCSIPPFQMKVKKAKGGAVRVRGVNGKQVVGFVYKDT